MLPYFRQLFFYIWYKKYQQIMGIPMESDPVPFMANLFLSHYEDKWIRLKKKKEKRSYNSRKNCQCFPHYWWFDSPEWWWKIWKGFTWNISSRTWIESTKQIIFWGIVFRSWISNFQIQILRYVFMVHRWLVSIFHCWNTIPVK